MTEETLYDLRCYVSDCFNHRGYTRDAVELDDSGYQKLSQLMTTEYDLTHSDVDEVVGELEELVAQYIMDNSPKFTDND